VASALGAVVERLEREQGPGSGGWGWGRLRPLVLRHPFGGRRPFDRAFNLGRLACGGDTNTVAQASSPPLDPLCDPLYVGTLRFAVDVGEWDRSRFVLAGGQSGNPLSPHYADQFEHWRRGEAIPLAFSEATVARATRATLRLEPRAAG
jgi:penicillin amidase